MSPKAKMGNVGFNLMTIHMFLLIAITLIVAIPLKIVHVIVSYVLSWVTMPLADATRSYENELVARGLLKKDKDLK